jgi:nucleoside-diphosphate-sugar epimerase
MDSGGDSGLILVTGANGHIGSELCRVLRASGRKFLPIDLKPDPTRGVVACDLRAKGKVSKVFGSHPIRIVVHTAGILPSAFNSDPLQGATVNVGGSVQLLQDAIHGNVKRFVFASSMSVYGSTASSRPLTEDAPAAPDEGYGASKRTVELIGNALAKQAPIQFVCLRIARVIGPGIKKTSSPWRSQIFESASDLNVIHMPFAPDAKVSLVHVEEVARMLSILANAARVREHTYNTPAEIWEARDLKRAVEELVGIQVELGEDGGGPICNGERFAKEFGFRWNGIRERLAFSSRNSATAWS